MYIMLKAAKSTDDDGQKSTTVVNPLARPQRTSPRPRRVFPVAASCSSAPVRAGLLGGQKAPQWRPHLGYAPSRGSGNKLGLSGCHDTCEHRGPPPASLGQPLLEPPAVTRGHEGWCPPGALQQGTRAGSLGQLCPLIPTSGASWAAAAKGHSDCANPTLLLWHEAKST